MVKDFFTTTTNDWTHPSGMLHAYIVPQGTAKGRLAAATESIRALPFLAPQPVDGLHGTVQRFPFLLKDLDAGALERLREAAAGTAGKLAPLRLAFGRPCAMNNSVIVTADAADPSWLALVQATRDAAEAALGPEALEYTPPFGPHMTLAYAIADGPDDQIEEAVYPGGDAAGPIGEVVFDQLAWCAVHQNKAEGTYTFETVFSSPLTG